MKRTLRAGRETELGYRLVEAVAPIRSPVSINKIGRLVDQGCESPAFPQRCGQPVLCTVLAGAYLLGGAKRKIRAWTLLLVVGLTCALSATIHPTLLWLSLGALLFAFLCVIGG